VTAWLVRRIAASIAIIFAVVTLTFFLMAVAPGEELLGPEEVQVDPRVREEIRRQWGLDQPPLVRYVKYLRQVARGNFGESFSLHRPVADALAEAIPNTLLLAGAALLIDFLVGLGLGVYQAWRVHRLPDVVLSNVTLFLYSVPTFWLGLILLLVFAEWLGWFPVAGMSDPILCPTVSSFYCAMDRLWHLALPAATLGFVGAAGTARFQRAAMLEVAAQDYIRTARAKGASERRVVLRHQLRNALLSFITLFGLAFPFLLTGAVLIETIFAWPGMGRLATDAILRRDAPVVNAAVLLASTLVVSGSLLADVLLAVVDPRLRVRGAA
jgi:peptide/nickel transport system permease protein